MSNNTVLSPKQTEVATLLSADLSQIAAAKEAGISRSTIQRWLQNETFAAEVERLRKLRTMTKGQMIAALEDANLEEWLSAIKTHIEAVEKASILAQSGGFAAVTKGMRRLKDLPDEALKPSDAIALVKAGQELLSASFEWKAEVMGLHELVERLEGSK